MMWAKSWQTPRRAVNASITEVLMLVAPGAVAEIAMNLVHQLFRAELERAALYQAIRSVIMNVCLILT